MDLYLAIITSVLVLTQIIRITQNTISLFHQERELKKNVGWIKEVELSKADFELKREVTKMLYTKLKEEESEE